MKQNATNEFKDGLNLDLHPIVTPNTVLTDNLNGTFITYNGNEFCLQNDRGNKEVASLTPRFTPIGIKEHNGILYIVSVNGNTTEIGTFPSPNWNVKNGQLNSNYSALHNYYRKETETRYCIWSYYDADEMNESGIDVDLSLLESIRERYDIFETGNIFGDNHANYLYSLDESQRDLLYNELNVAFPGVFGKKTETITYDGDLSSMQFISKYTTKTPITIEIQDSYDGSVNLILVADQCPTRIINTAFSVKGNEYEIIDRNQSIATNYYFSDKFDEDTELIRTSNVLTNIDLLGVQSGGQFKGGNYTFYIKFGDADYNQTDVVAESGIVSIFNGNDGVPSTISGTLADERTDKMIHLAITGLNHVYSKIYIYYSREYSDTQGYRMTEYGMFNEPIDMIQKEYEETFESGEKGQSIWLTGFEQTVPINSEELNVDYHTIDWARAETQHSNMLFLGNIGQEETFELYHKLEKFTKNHVNVYACEDSEHIVPVSIDYKSGKEYYDTLNIYNYLGYWPDEIYRLGIVYVLKDGSTTPVFNPYGGTFYEDSGTHLYKSDNSNEFGVFLTPKFSVFKTEEKIIDDEETAVQSVNPIYFNIEFDSLPEDVLGWFVVRQKRIPRTICQGISIGIEKKSHLPAIYNGKSWDIESFLSYDRSLKSLDELANNIEELKDDNDKWWANFIPHLVLPSITTLIYGAIKSITNKSQLKSLLSRYTTIPVLKYLNKNLTVWVPSTMYLAVKSRDFAEEEQLSNMNNGGFDAARNGYDMYQIKYDSQASGETMIYSCDYIVYKYLYDSDTKTWSKSDTQQNAIYFTDNINEYPTSLSLTDLNNNPISADAVNVDDNDFITYLNTLSENKNSNIDWMKRIISLSKDELLGNGLLSLDPCVKSEVASILDGSEFIIEPQYTNTCFRNRERLYEFTNNTAVNNENDLKNIKCVFIQPNTNVKVVDEYAFSNIAGNASSVEQYKELDSVFNVLKEDEDSYLPVSNDSDLADNIGNINNINIVRGTYCPYIGITTNDLNPCEIYSIRLKNETIDNLFTVREQDNSEYYCISNRTSKLNLNIYRGDCYTNTVTIRINKNFIDSTAPAVEQIVDEETWAKWVLLNKNDFNEVLKEKTVKEAIWDQVNLSDVNTVDLGMWVTFKCLSSYNLGLRSIDRFHTDEIALLGSPRSFYPLNGLSTATGTKVGDSYLLNDGLSATVGRKRYNLMPDVPYSKSEFSNRIMFSNVNITDAFTNGYRTFQGLAYKDYDKQYGAITKLISLGQNIFIVMEHGLGLVPVNPKALMQTTTGETIHIYGYGVLPDEMTIISQDYGSKYEHSVIRTPIGIYGIDVDAKKIWRFSDKQGFETISDMKIETYLKDNLESQEIEMGKSDIRTHYNGKKGDLMFTWYCNGEIYSICYNERQNLWVTRYDWTPIVSENINDEFYSLNKAFVPGTEESDPTYSSDYRIWDHHYQVGKENNYVSTWYDNNRGFEFEFVVSDPIGINKIFENLQIISNNVSPEELQITVIGDDYTFKRNEIIPDYERKEYPDDITWTTSNIHENDKEYRELENTVYKWDWRLHQMAIVNTQELRDIYKHGRRLGNMQYKNGMWFIQIDPLRFNINALQQKKEIRIRDKWAKIRIRYSGKDLAIITAIRTLINI